MIAAQTLLGYYEQVYQVSRDLRPSTAYQYDRSLRIYCDWAGRDPPLSEIDDMAVSTCLRDLKPSYSQHTLRRVRTVLVVLTNHAARQGLCRRLASVRPVRVAPRNPDAWTLPQLRRLLEATKRLGKHGPYLEALLRAGWDSGLRREDLERIRLSNIDTETGAVAIQQQKTDDPILVQFRAETIRAMQLVGSDQPLRYPGNPRNVYRQWRRLCRLAGVPYGGPQKLRRTAATHCELANPGSASTFLGHRSPGLAARHYLDRRILQRDRPRPEEL